MHIAYDNLPGYNNLFNSYINDISFIHEFFNQYFDIEGIKRVIQDKSSTYNQGRVSREIIYNILINQNKIFNSQNSTFKNIELLKSHNTFAIVTGQQAGLFTGPLYTIYKAINAIKLSNYLNEEIKDVNFVPIFWIESDDHDFLEINNINIIDKNNSKTSIKYFGTDIEQDKYLSPISSILLERNINDLIKETKDKLPESEFKQQLFDYIERSYIEGISFPVAFARFFNFVLQDRGLIFFSPSDSEVKNLLIPIFEKELNNFPQSCKSVIDSSAKLESQGYEPQVKPKSINLFYNLKNCRYAIEPADNMFSLKNSRKKLLKEELFDDLYKYPENFSPNVILRPICQDFLIPTAIYVAGPSEVSYFAQLKGVYNFFNITMPVIYPRSSLTLIDNKIRSLLTKYELSEKDLFDSDNLKKKIFNTLGEIYSFNFFNDFIDDLNALFYKYSKRLEEVDKNLKEFFNKKNDKYLNNLEVLKKKFLESLERQNANVSNRIELIQNFIIPDGKLQERFYNITFLLNRHGLELIDFLFRNINIEIFKHQVIEIEPISTRDVSK